MINFFGQGLRSAKIIKKLAFRQQWVKKCILANSRKFSQVGETSRDSFKRKTQVGQLCSSYQIPLKISCTSCFDKEETIWPQGVHITKVWSFEITLHKSCFNSKNVMKDHWTTQIFSVGKDFKRLNHRSLNKEKISMILFLGFYRLRHKRMHKFRQKRSPPYVLAPSGIFTCTFTSLFP